MAEGGAASIGAGRDLIVGRGLIEILPDFKKWGKTLAADMRVARAQMDGTAAGFKKSAAGIGTAMATAGKGASLVGLGVAAASVKMAGDFQAQTAVLQTAAGETSKNLGVVRKGILSISEGTGTGIKNLTDGMYTIEKAGFRGAEGLKILKAAAQGAREENANLADVTNAMTSVMASYHLKANMSVQVMNAMKTAAGEGKITMEEFSGALSTVLPIASANKISFAQVAGSMATLTQHGTSAREATHELAATIRALASPNNVASREMARFGLSSVDVSKNLGKRGLSGTIDLLVSTITKEMGPAGVGLQKTFEGTKQASQDAQLMLGKMQGQTKATAEEYLKGKMSIGDWNKVLKGSAVDQRPMLQNFKSLVDRSRGFSRELKNGGPAAHTFTDALKKMSGGAIGLNTILQLSGESAAGNEERIKKVGESYNHASKDVEGWKTTQKLLNTQLDMAKQQLQVLAINIGTKLIPVVAFVVKLFAEHKNVTIALVGTILSLVAALTAAYLVQKAMTVYTALATAAMFAFNVVTMRSTESLAVLRAQLAVLWVQERLVAIWTAITSSAFWGLAAAILANPLTWIIVGVVALIAGIVLLATKTKFFQKTWALVWGGIKKVVSLFVGWLKKNWQLVVFTILTGPIGLAAAMIVRHWKAVKGAFMTAFDWVKKHWVLIASLLLGPISAAAYQIYKHWDAVSGFFKNVFDKVAGFATDLGKTLGDFFSKLPGRLGKFFSSLPGTIGHWFVVAGQAIADFFTKLPGQILRFAVGMDKVLTGVGKDLIKGLWKGATDFFTQSVPGFFKIIWKGLVDFFKNVFGIHSPSTVYASIGMDLMRGLFVGMIKIANTATSWLTDHIFKPMTGFFKNAASWLYQHGRNIILGMIKGNLDVAVTLANWLTTHVYRPIVNFFSRSISWLVNGGRDIMNGMFTGLKNIWSSVSTWFSNRKSAIQGYFSAAGSWLTSKGSSIISSLWDGFKEKWKDLIGWVGSLKDKIISKIVEVFKIGSPAKTMVPYGMHIMAGLMKGILQGGGALKTIVKGIFHSTTDVFKRGGKLLGSLVSNIGSAIGLGDPGAQGSAQQYAQLYMKTLGFGPSQWPALKALWNGESGWNPLATNQSSGAHGIPQALPASKMRSEGSDYWTNAATQIRWGLKYIKAVYGSPSNAYSKWLARKPHWYDSGGLARGIGAIFKNTSRPERVLSPRQTEAFERLVDKLPAQGHHGGTTVINAHFHNHGIIGSKHEMENWLVDSIDQLQRRGRIKVITRTGG